ncbi:MAG TPA: prolyl oligopeptidase family serine peptidase [Parafilimonas sp.]|nr:prolyl oligopeptidase family serine peptidase [Parafilimonas sp.]
MRKLKCIAFLILLLFSNTSCKKETSQIVTRSYVNLAKKSALVGRQEQITIATGDNTYPTSQALLWRPKGYEDSEKSEKSYPLIIALDGVGEQGTDINLLLHTGTIASRIAGGWNARSINPVDGKSYKFIVFTPQCPIVNGWGWSAKHIKTMLSILKTSYRIDTTRIYITGYSAGGWGLWSCITDDESLCKQFAAIVPVSAASADHPDKLTNVGKYGIACWNICGANDAFYTNAVKYTNTINSANPPVPAVLTGIKDVGHSAWIQAYDTSWRVNKKNFFEWLLQYHK